MEYEIVQVARRIRELRDILGFSVHEMAETVDWHGRGIPRV